MTDAEAAREGGTRAAQWRTRRRRRHAEASLRPASLDEFVGQRAACAQSARLHRRRRGRREALDHVLLHGPPGLGKTTLAQIVARELGVGFRATSGPVIARAGRSRGAAHQPRAARRAVHRRDPSAGPVVEEILYPAMEDCKLDLMIGEGPAARSVRIDLPPFTLVGATTRAGLITTPLRDRFGIPLRLEFYDVDDLAADRPPRRRAAGHGAGRGRRARDRRARARHAARGRPAAAPGARLRRGGRRRLRRPRGGRRGADAPGGRRAAGSTPPTGAICAASPSSTAAGRSGSKPWPRRWPSSATPSRT